MEELLSKRSSLVKRIDSPGSVHPAVFLFKQHWTNLPPESIRTVCSICMKPLSIQLLAGCFGSVKAQSSLSACQGEYLAAAVLQLTI